jgi:hypothetical protein
MHEDDPVSVRMHLSVPGFAAAIVLGADHTPAPGCAAIVPRLRRRPLDNRLF